MEFPPRFTEVKQETRKSCITRTKHITTHAGINEASASEAELEVVGHVRPIKQHTYTKKIKAHADQSLAQSLAQADHSLAQSLAQADQSLAQSLAQADQSFAQSLAQADHSLAQSLSQADQSFAQSLAQADHSLAQSLAQADQSLAQSLAQADQSFAQSLAQADHSLAQSLAQADQSLAHSLAQADQSFAQSLAQADHSLAQSLAQADHSLAQSLAQADHSLAQSLAQADHSLAQSLAQADHSLTQADHRLASEGSSCTDYEEARIGVSSALFISAPQRSIVGAVNQSVLLPVSYRMNGSLNVPLLIAWKRNDISNAIIAYKLNNISLGEDGSPLKCDGSLFTHDTYLDRVIFYPENASLRLLSLQVNDGGVYTVSFRDARQSRDITLSVSSAQEPPGNGTSEGASGTWSLWTALA
ncbi:hypothetical protein NDU88_007546 [Pleurodeles waltl]|uniref:Uncharacterized protein n=1 Tax=Pleurodeles waltl TaxID=8319 RepID=A0AAV7MQJ2_PLEWA|nr:hypothetical protein NDU88_007546 [Pleurodeles waltl]